ncbi:MAG: hypothetical protein AB1500_13180, partial [Bacillota bacterium]
EWLKADADRDTVAQPLRTEGVTDDKFKDMEDVIRSTESRSVFTFLKNVHQITTNVWSVYNALTDEDWFYVRQKGTLAASNMIEEDAKNPDPNHRMRGVFTDYYRLNTYVIDFLREKELFLHQSSPQTTTGGEKEVSSGVKWDLGGKLSGSVLCLPEKKDKPKEAVDNVKCELKLGAELTFGLTLNKTFTYDIPDVAIRSIAGSSLNNAGWEYEIRRPHFRSGFGCVGFEGLGPLTPMSRATFQPLAQWMWRVADSEARKIMPSGFLVDVEVSTRMVMMEIGIPACPVNIKDDFVRRSQRDRAVIPYPYRPEK